MWLCEIMRYGKFEDIILQHFYPSIFGRDAFATMRYVTLLNVSEIRDISNDERKVPFKNDEYLASGTSSFRKACKSIIRDNKS